MSAPKTKRTRPLGSDVELLQVRLSDAELLDWGQRLAQVEVDLREHQLRAKAVRKELKEEEAKLKAIRSSLAGVVRSKEEARPVEIQSYLSARGQVEDIRTDTGEVVRTRPAREGELQGRMFDGEGSV